MRVVIADDSMLLREGLKLLLAEAGIETCAAVGDGEALETALAEHRPDVAIIDIRMPPTYTH
jgi:DNA-binding NarL/FixJ family response regulator